MGGDLLRHHSVRNLGPMSKRCAHNLQRRMNRERTACGVAPLRRCLSPYLDLSTIIPCPPNLQGTGVFVLPKCSLVAVLPQK